MTNTKEKRNIDGNLKQSDESSEDTSDFGYYTPYSQRSGPLPQCETQADVSLTWTGESNVWQSAAQGNIAWVETFLASGLDVDVRDNEDRTPCYTQRRKARMIRLSFCSNDGAGVNLRDLYGLTPLMVAASGGHAATVRLLLERGADVNARSSLTNPPDVTASEMAAQQGHSHIVQLLKEISAHD
jgi:FOG: Ankyrin repeat